MTRCGLRHGRGVPGASPRRGERSLVGGRESDAAAADDTLLLTMSENASVADGQKAALADGKATAGRRPGRFPFVAGCRLMSQPPA